MSKLKSLAPWLVSGLLAIFGLGSIALAVGGLNWGNVEEKLAQLIYDKMSDEGGDMIGASGTRFPNGISADVNSPSAGQIRGSLINSGAVTTYSATSTVTAAEVCSSRIWNLAASSGNNPTITFPSATTLLATCLTVNGDKLGSISVYNDSTSTYSLLAGAGSSIRWSRPSTTILSGTRADISFFRTSTAGYGVSVNIFAD